MTDTDTELLRIENVTRDYRQGDQTVHALRNVSFTAARGEFIAIAGPSGSGKTTLLNLCAGLDHPTEGTVRLAGRDLSTMSRQQLADMRLREVGFIFQAYNLIPVLSAEENAEFILLLQGVPFAERRRRVRALLHEVGLEGMESRRPGQLSGGQQQRVAVARAIAAEPRLVLADEPTANLDSTSSQQVIDLIASLNRDHGQTIVMVTHEREYALGCHRIIHMEDGRIVNEEQLR